MRKNYLLLDDVKDFKLTMGQNLEGEETSDDTFEENEITHVETSSRFRHLDVFSLLKLNNQILEMGKMDKIGMFFRLCWNIF